MKNSLKLLPAGLIPFALGYAFNYLILRFPLFVRFIFPLSLLCTVLWGRLSYTLSNPRESPFPQALLMCSPGLLVLALLLFQALVLYLGTLNDNYLSISFIIHGFLSFIKLFYVFF